MFICSRLDGGGGGGRNGELAPSKGSKSGAGRFKDAPPLDLYQYSTTVSHHEVSL